MVVGLLRRNPHTIRDDTEGRIHVTWVPHKQMGNIQHKFWLVIESDPPGLSISVERVKEVMNDELCHLEMIVSRFIYIFYLFTINNGLWLVTVSLGHWYLTASKDCAAIIELHSVKQNNPVSMTQWEFMTQTWLYYLWANSQLGLIILKFKRIKLLHLLLILRKIILHQLTFFDRATWPFIVIWAFSRAYIVLVTSIARTRKTATSSYFLPL